MAKPHNVALAIVTASLNSDAQTHACLQSWETKAACAHPTYVIAGQYGVVPAFTLGVQQAFAEGAEAVVCLHDDVRIDQRDWDFLVQAVLDTGVKFAGFGGATQLGSADLYQRPYDPMQLARGGFMSNMQDAEAHGKRVRTITPAVVFDGFCTIGTKDWFLGAWEWMRDHGIVHHFYDGVLGCLAARAGVQPGMLIPVECHHFGGQTAVGNQDYHRWAKQQREDGDSGFWIESHLLGYKEFKDQLPLTLGKYR